MSHYTCSIDGCARKRKSRGWCNTHYEAWRITGNPVRKARPSPEDEIAAKTKHEGDCLVWTGYLTPVGYGQITYKGRARRVHAVVWEIAHGKPPKGLVIDHTCHNRRCCNIEHLRLATLHQNASNLSGGHKGSETGVRNVYRGKAGRFYAMVHSRGISHYLGTFDTVEDADAVATAKREELFGEFAGYSRRGVDERTRSRG